jgi:hypothetical protein
MNSAAFLQEQWTGVILGMTQPLDGSGQNNRDRPLSDRHQVSFW